MTTPNQYLTQIQQHRSSEAGFETLQATLTEAATTASQNNDATLASALKEVDEKYVAAYQKAKETGGSAWPEFEKFVTQFERALVNAKEKDA